MRRLPARCPCLLRPVPGRVKIGAMSDVGLQFSRVRAAGEQQWHVHRAGRFIGSIVERGGGFQASRIVEGELRSQRFNDRDAAAEWLAAIAPPPRRALPVTA